MKSSNNSSPTPEVPIPAAWVTWGFNQMSQWNILIRTAIRTDKELILHVGSGIVADSDPEAEFQETEDKAAGWRQALYNTRPVDTLSHAQRQNAGQPPHQT